MTTLAGVYKVTLKQLSERLYEVEKTERYGYRNGATEESRFWTPTGIAYDENNEKIYVTDKDNHRIRVIDPETGVTEDFAGSGVRGFRDANISSEAQFNYPSGVTVDDAGNVYVADMHNHRIRAILPGGGVITIAGGVPGFADLPGTGAMFNYPTGLCAAKDGTLFVTDMNNHKIRKIFVGPGGATGTNRLVVTFAGGIAGWKDAFGVFSKFHSPTDVTLHHASGSIFVADRSNQRIRKVDKYGTVTTIAGTSLGDADAQDSMLARFNFPFGIVVSQVPNPAYPTVGPDIYFTDSFNNRIRVLHAHYYDPKIPALPGEQRPARNCTTVAGSVPGYKDGYANMSTMFVPSAITLSDAGVLYFADASNNVVRKIQQFNTWQKSDDTGTLCAKPSGTCGIKRQCRDESGALCAYRDDACLSGNLCECDVFFHNATCVELVEDTSAASALRCSVWMAAWPILAALAMTR